MKIMHQIDDQKDIAFNREVNNVNAGLMDSDSDLDYLVMITLVLDDPNCDRNKKISVFLISDWNFSWTLYDSKRGP